MTTTNNCNYTAYYSTEKLRGIEYAFHADSDKEAIEFCKNKFCDVKILLIKNPEGLTEGLAGGVIVAEIEI